MAIKLAERYPTRAGDPSLAHPTGSFKNKSAPGAVDGTPLEKDWANDLLGARDAILAEAEIVADGDVETAEDSQVLTALLSIIASKAPSQDQLIWNAGLSTVESLISAAKLDAKIKTLALGEGQTPLDVTASREADIIYQNTSGRSRFVHIYLVSTTNGGRPFQISENGSTNWINFGTSGITDPSGVDYENVYAIVPAGWRYRVLGSCIIEDWSEM